MSNDSSTILLPTSMNISQEKSWWRNCSKSSMKTMPSLVYQSNKMDQVVKMAKRVASKGENVLISGESGTGKSLIAEVLHKKSDRCDGPFITVNCRTSDESLLERELFGYESQNFMGTNTKKIGLIEMAKGGTLFFDEVDRFSHKLQTKILGFLQEKDAISMDVHIICATNLDLGKAVAKKSFREDLFDHISTITIEVPPLRRRQEDIPMLVNHFLSLHGDQGSSSGCEKNVSPEAMELFCSYVWPGNVRELKSVCENLLVLSQERTIKPADLPEDIRYPKMEKLLSIGEYDPALTLAEIERFFILKALDHFEGNKTRAAKALGVTIKTIYNKLNQYGESDRFSVHAKTQGE